MPLADGDGSGTNDALNCTGKGLQLQCVNSRDQISSGGHGDYFPSCTNTMQAAMSTGMSIVAPSRKAM